MKENKTKKTIGFIGNGWGAVAAVKSLKENFILHYSTNDNKVVNELIKQKAYLRFDKIEDLDNKIIISAGYTSIVHPKLIESHTIINVHYSLLPKYRGLHSTAWEIMNDEEKLGLSIHIMTSFIDDGPIIYQKSFKNDKISSATDYIKIKNKFIANNLGNIVLKYLNNELIPIEQDKKEASWVGKEVINIT